MIMVTDAHDNPAGDTGASESGFVIPLEILGELLDLERSFPSGVSYRFHALSRFDQRVEAS